MLKGYVARERLGTPDLNHPDNIKEAHFTKKKQVGLLIFLQMLYIINTPVSNKHIAFHT